MNYEELKEEARDARRALDSKCEETMERLQQMQGFSRVLEAAEQVLDENAGRTRGQVPVSLNKLTPHFINKKTPLSPSFHRKSRRRVFCKGSN